MDKAKNKQPTKKPVQDDFEMTDEELNQILASYKPDDDSERLDRLIARVKEQLDSKPKP